MAELVRLRSVHFFFAKWSSLKSKNQLLFRIQESASKLQDFSEIFLIIAIKSAKLDEDTLQFRIKKQIRN